MHSLSNTSSSISFENMQSSRILIQRLVVFVGWLCNIPLMVHSKEALITFKSTDSILIPKTMNSREAKLQYMVQVLQSRSSKMETSVRDLVRNSTEACSIESYWISNQLYVSNVSPDQWTRIEHLSNVQEIRPLQEFFAHSDTALVEEEEDMTRAPRNQLEWNIDRIQAPKAWAKGFTGENALVAVLDSGARPSHDALHHSYTNLWYDPVSGGGPVDKIGHGTHILGTIVGRNGIGVAPGAKWMACRACEGYRCSERTILACAQWIICPDGDCTATPHVVHASWGTGSITSTLSKVIEMWDKANIIPVFPSGYAGPRCKSLELPGAMDRVIAVGASGKRDEVARGSSYGPSQFTARIKPEVVAPGVIIRSAGSNSDSSYATITGIAATHVTGIIALLKGATPYLNFDQVVAKLQAGADQENTQSSGHTCRGIPDTKFPNYAFGYGRVNAYRTVMEL